MECTLQKVNPDFSTLISCVLAFLASISTDLENVSHYRVNMMIQFVEYLLTARCIYHLYSS